MDKSIEHCRRGTHFPLIVSHIMNTTTDFGRINLVIYCSNLIMIAFKGCVISMHSIDFTLQINHRGTCCVYNILSCNGQLFGFLKHFKSIFQFIYKLLKSNKALFEIKLWER